jgi:dihydroorotate dehydrogenase (fumarate)
MTSLKTRFFGLELQNPIIVASSSLTSDLNKIREFSEKGVGAVVLKSVFEEEIISEYDEVTRNKSAAHFHEFMDYFDYKIRDQVLANYGRLIKDAKNVSRVPVIASINCVTAGDWLQFASQVQDAGADAIELNLFILPCDPTRKAEDNRRFYLESVKETASRVKIPVSVKISSYFSDLAAICNDLDHENISGITMFNRFPGPDIDIDKEKVVEAGILSNENEHLLPLRWIGILAPRLQCPLAASTGIHEAGQVIKMLLAGASAVQMASAFYRHGSSHVSEILRHLTSWMQEKGYESIDDFKGKLSLTRATNPALYQRAQYMSNFGGYRGR